MTIPPFITKVITSYYKFVAGGVVLIILATGYALVLGPKITSVQSSQVTAKNNVEADLLTKQAYVSALRESNAKFTTILPLETRERINMFIPSDADFPGLLLTVNNIVAQAQMNLDSLTVGQGGQVAVSGSSSSLTEDASGGTPTAKAATVAGVNLKTQDVTISVSGGSSYDAFKQLLGLFESSQRLFDVISVTYDAASAEGTTGETTAATTWTLVLRTYYLPVK